MEAKHTPGPWKVELGDGIFIVGQANDDLIFTLGSTSISTDPEANARRIVACVNACEGINPEAVPGLLEAAEAVIRFYHEPRFTPNNQWKALKATIAKAKGNGR